MGSREGVLRTFQDSCYQGCKNPADVSRKPVTGQLRKKRLLRLVNMDAIAEQKHFLGPNVSGRPETCKAEDKVYFSMHGNA